MGWIDPYCTCICTFLFFPFIFIFIVIFISILVGAFAMCCSRPIRWMDGQGAWSFRCRCMGRAGRTFTSNHSHSRTVFSLYGSTVGTSKCAPLSPSLSVVSDGWHLVLQFGMWRGRVGNVQVLRARVHTVMTRSRPTGWLTDWLGVDITRRSLRARAGWLAAGFRRV